MIDLKDPKVRSELMREMGKRGSAAAIRNTSARERKAIAKKAAKARWAKSAKKD